MAIYFGNDKIKEIYVGSDKIKEVYHGSDLVWSGEDTRGYWVHKNTGVKTYFGLEDPSIVNGILSYPSWAYDCSEIKFPSGVTGLESESFVFNEALTSITIPESVVSIGAGCFYYCTSLTLATVLPAIPPSLGAMVFGDVHSSFNIKVHSPYVDDYKAAINWTEYADKISAI